MAHPATTVVRRRGEHRTAARTARRGRPSPLAILSPLLVRASRDVVAQLDQPIALVSADDRIRYANESFMRTFGVAAPVEGRSLYDIVDGAFDAPELREQLGRIRDGDRVHGWRFEGSFPRIGRKVLSIDLVALRGAFFETGLTLISVRDETDRAALESDVARRVQEESDLAARLGRLRAAETSAATASRILDELIGIQDFDYLVLSTFGVGQQLVPLALKVPPGTPLTVGRPVPDARARYLRQRALTGPWLEMWQTRPDDGEYGERLAAAGLRAAAYAPIHGPTSLIGLLVMGTSSAAAAERIGDQLPTLLSFAAIAGALIGSAQERHNQDAAARVELSTIIDEERFAPVFQPVVELASSRVVGYEALTRFDDGRSPAERFAEAATLGLDTELELACLRRSLAAAPGLAPGAWVGLNVSPELLVSSDELLTVLPMADREILLEITEHAPVADYGALHRAIAALGDRVRVAVDDAGAGYSGLQRIIELAPDLIKLDITLVRGIEADPGRQALVAGMVHFAKQTGSTLLAEGIETPAEAELLHELGVDLGQGYLFGRPEPATLRDQAFAPPIR
jgi:EAL domain-containing protein (putative c-di-GMP-specific phosphodiesterase class I)